MTHRDTWSREGLDAHIRSIYLSAETGLLEVRLDRADPERRRLFFQRGELYLPAGHPLAQRAEELLADRTAVAEVELLSFVARVAAAVASWREGEVTWLPGAEHLARRLVGPLPTLHLVMELAVAGKSGVELLAGLGGSGARLVAAEVDARLARAPFLGREELDLLARVRRPVRLGELLTEAGRDRYPTLCRLARFAALGWLRHEAENGGARFSAEIVRRMAARVAPDLEHRPVKLDPRAHREVLADLLAGVGGRTHYELLSVPPTASLAEIHDAYQELARLVHPSHVSRLGLEGRELALELLFESATESYFTLSDAHRRAAYDRSLGLPAARVLSPEERREEKKELARRYYERARSLLEAGDVHFAVELMRDAVRYDPRPEYHLLMGEAQARNELRLRQAADSFRKAVAGQPDDPRALLGLARVAEDLGRWNDARRAYERLLEVGGEANENVAATGIARIDAAQRQEAKAAAGEGKKGFWKRWFGG